MKKIFLAASVLLFSNFALADYFFCEIQATYGYVRARNEADYKVLKTSVEDSEFRCEGYIQGSTTYVKATSINSENVEYASARNSSMAEVTITGLSNQGDYLSTVVCKCGMN